VRQIRHHGQLLQIETPASTAEQVARWQVQVLKTVAAQGEGVEELRQRIEAHYAWLAESGELQAREGLRVAHALENIIQAELNRRIRASLPLTRLRGLVEAVRQRTTDPYTAAAALLAEI